MKSVPEDVSGDVVLSFLELKPMSHICGASEPFTLCYAALQELPSVMIFSFVELKPTSHIRADL